MSYKCCALIIALAILPEWGIGNAQSSPPQAQASNPIKLSIIVDGSVTPEQIPDVLAYQHFLTTIAAHRSPSAQEQARQAAQVLPIGLSSADQQALIAGLTSLRDQLDAIESARAKITASGSAAAQLSDLNAQASAAVAKARTGLLQALTPDGVSRIDHYVQTHVKPRIKIYGGEH